MLDAESLKKVSRDVVKALSIVETLSEQVLGLVMAQQGVPVGELAPVMEWLRAHGILRRPITDRGYVTLGVNGQRLLKSMDEQQARRAMTLAGVGAVGHAAPVVRR